MVSFNIFVEKMYSEFVKNSRILFLMHYTLLLHV